MAPGGDSARLFLALWPGPASRRALAAESARWRWHDGAARVPPERLHVTLHYLGLLPIARQPAIADGLQVPFTPFSLELGRASLWPHGLAVLEPRQLPEPLRRLQRDLADALRALGLEPESRAYRPHVTLARHAGGATLPPDAPSWRWPIRSYALVESTSRPRLTYRVLRLYR